MKCRYYVHFHFIIDRILAFYVISLIIVLLFTILYVQQPLLKTHFPSHFALAIKYAKLLRVKVSQLNFYNKIYIIF